MVLFHLFATEQVVCLHACPNIAMVSTCCAMILLLSGTEELLINMYVVCKVAKVVLG